MHILLTGGGTAGHVVPNLAIAAAIQERTKARISYMGSRRGMEGEMVREAGLDFYGVSTGKLRRYLDMQNLTDMFRVPLGVFQAWLKLGSLKPDLVFSKGGYVAVPVVFAAWLRRIPVVIHESDAIPGLATRLTARFAKKILLGYEEASHELGRYRKKCETVGHPLREEVLAGKRKKGLEITGFSGEKPVLLVMGGSLGAQQLNDLVFQEQAELEKVYDIVHLFGKGKGKSIRKKHYFSEPYLGEELKDIYAITNAVISRAGANSLAELEALGIPTLIYPLGRQASRGDQLANAQAMVLKYKWFALADEEKPAFKQLAALPKKRQKSKSKNAVQTIADCLIKI